MIDPRDGRVVYAIVGTGGFLGIGRDHVMVPWENVTVSWDQQRVLVTMEEQILDEAPRGWVGVPETPPATAPAPPRRQ